MKKESIISAILGVGTTFFIVMICLPPVQKPSDIQRRLGLSSVPGDVIEDEEEQQQQQQQSNSTDDDLLSGEYLNVKGNYSFLPDFGNF